jgi:hypothetical protein
VSRALNPAEAVPADGVVDMSELGCEDCSHPVPAATVMGEATVGARDPASVVAAEAGHAALATGEVGNAQAMVALDITGELPQ